jgi:hypothetical protein
MSGQRTSLTTHSVQTPSGRVSYAAAGSAPAALFVHGVLNRAAPTLCDGSRNAIMNGAGSSRR